MMKTLLRRAAGPLAASALVAALVATPAAAAEPSPDEPSSSLTSALLALYAEQSGQTLDSYLRANDVMVGTTSGLTALLSGEQAQAATGQDGVTSLQAGTVAELDDQLAQTGLSLDLRSYTSLSDLAADVVAKSHTADGAVTLAGAQWAAQLGTLRTPELTAPQVGQPTAPSISQEALAFGLLMDQSLARTVLAAPDLFAAAASSGVGSDALAGVFGEQMLAAWDASSTELTSVLPDKCTGAMLAVMASGNPAAGDDYGSCNPACVTGGLYLNAQSSKLFGATSNLMSGQTGQLWTYETLQAAQSWRAQDMLEQNPALVQQLLADDGTAGGAASCAQASAQTSATLSQTLPGIFSQLRQD